MAASIRSSVHDPHRGWSSWIYAELFPDPLAIGKVHGQQFLEGR
jgi:hypothetical protein